MKKILTTLLIIVFSMQLMVAQSLKRANHLFENRAYLDAAEIFLAEDAKSQEILEKLGDCYYFNSDMQNASLWYNVLMDEYYENGSVESTYFFKLAQALKGNSKFDEGDKWLQIYYESEGISTTSNMNTISFFESLNDGIERPYIVQPISENTAGSEFGVSMNGDKVLFTSSRGGGKIYDWNNLPYLDLYEATINENGDLTNITALNSDVNTKMHESNGIISKDGQTMYFTRNNFNGSKKGRDKNKVTHLKIYKAKLVDGEWGNITEVPFNNDNYSTMHPALNSDETKLYFSSDMPGSLGSFDLYVVDINSNGTYGTPENLGNKINTPQREQFPFMSSSNNLYFASDGHFGLGGLDIFKSEGSFGSPQNLSDKINSNLDDFSFSIDEDKEIGYFSSNRTGGKGNDDIYRFTRVKKSYINGIAQDKSTMNPLPGVLVTLIDGSGNTISEMTVGDDAKFTMETKPNKSYTLKGSLKSYSSTEITFSTDNKGNASKNILLTLESYESANEKIVVDHGKLQIKIDPIYFYFDSWDIIPESALALDDVVAIMKKYPEMVIEIGTHTDSRGDDAYNLDLSNKRANSVREYLVNNGISTDNVKSVGYGETQLLNRCSNDVRCWEREHYENRRCEFVILN